MIQYRFIEKRQHNAVYVVFLCLEKGRYLKV